MTRGHRRDMRSSRLITDEYYKKRHLRGDIYSTICVECVGDHSGLGLTVDVNRTTFDEDFLHFRSQ